MLGKMLAGVLLMVGAVCGDVIGDAKSAYDREDYKTAFKLFQKACDGGNALGCNKLGNMYYSGEGVKQDIFKAVELHKKKKGQKKGTG